MKNKFNSKHKSPIRAMEEKIQKQHMIILPDALRMAKLFALRNQPHLKTGSLLNFIGPVKASYEKLAAEVILELQPELLKKDNEIDGDYSDRIENDLLKKIEELKHKIHLVVAEMETDEKPLARLKLGIALSGLLFVGELILNGQSFQAAGGSLLSSYLIGFAVSCAVLLFAHGAAIYYKKTESPIKKRLIFFGSLAIVSVVFIAGSILRSQFLASQGISINPAFFALFNVFFFIVSFILAVLLFPSRDVIIQYLKNLSLKKQIASHQKQIDNLNAQKDHNAAEFVGRTLERHGNYHACKYLVQIIWKLFEETVEKMKQVNESSREDCSLPDCFRMPIPGLDLPTINLTPQLPKK